MKNRIICTVKGVLAEMAFTFIIMGVGFIVSLLCEL